mgnify:CR=1 FL=1
MEQVSKRLRMLGLATRAGKVITGIDLCEKAVRQKKAKLVILAADAAESTVKTFRNCGLPVLTVPNKFELGKYTGKDYRSVCVVCDAGFAKAIQESEED